MNKKFYIFLAIMLSIPLLGVELNISPTVGIEVGGEVGKITEEYGTNKDKYDYKGVNYRLSIGTSLISMDKDDDIEHSLKLFYEQANGEIDYDTSGVNNDTVDSQEVGVGYDILFTKNTFRPFLGLELSRGSSEFEGISDDLDYFGFGIYTGLACKITKNLDLTGRIGYKKRTYDMKSIPGLQLAEGGMDMKIGLRCCF